MSFALGFFTYCLGSKGMYWWCELSISSGFSNNMQKEGELIIEHCNLFTLKKEELTSNSWFEISTSPGFSNNVFKVERLTIAHIGFPHLKGEELSFDSYFEANIITK